jgi:glucosyl-3-phosphoglycerate synthase
MLQNSYLKNARGFIKSYSDDAEVNALMYDRHLEELTVEHFMGFIGTAWEQCKSSNSTTQIPSWNRVLYSKPGIYDQLLRAVEEDNA